MVQTSGKLCVEKWKQELVARRARRLGFRGHDLKDAQQQVLFAVLGFRFRPDSPNGATERTALTSLIDRQLHTIRRAKARYHKHLDRLQRDRAAEGETRTTAAVGFHEQNVELVIDVRSALEGLAPEDRAVAIALAEGQTRREIAGQLHCDWHAVERSIARCRRHFQRLGLDQWLQ